MKREKEKIEIFEGIPWWSSIGKIPWRKKWQPTPLFLSGKSHGERNLAGYNPWVHKSQTWLSN